MFQIVEQTHDEKMAMYMEVPKKKLAEMLIACNDILSGCSYVKGDFLWVDGKHDKVYFKPITKK